MQDAYRYFYFFLHWRTENVSLCACKLAREDPFLWHSQLWKAGVLPVQVSANKIFPCLNFLSPAQSHIMAPGLFGFLPALHSLALPINTSHPCSDAPFSNPFPSSCISDPFASWSLPRHNHGKQLYSEAKAKNATATFATIKTSAGGGLLKLQRALTAQPRGSGASPWLAPRHWGAARQGPRGTRAGDARMERAGAPSKSFLLPNAWPRQVPEGGHFWASVADQTLLPQRCCVQCWQSALWAAELHVQPATTTHHGLSSPPQAGLQFRCQACYLFCISLFVQYLSGYSVCHFLVTDAFLPGLFYIPAAITFLSLEISFLPEFPPQTKSFIKHNLFQRYTICQVHPPSDLFLYLLLYLEILPICLPKSPSLQKVPPSAKNILFTRSVLLAGVFPLVSFPLHHFF